MSIPKEVFKVHPINYDDEHTDAGRFGVAIVPGITPGPDFKDELEGAYFAQ